MNLDPKTIMQMNIISSLLMGISLFVVSKGYLSNIKGIKRWALATLIQSLGWIFVAALRGVIPDFLSIVIGQAFLLLCLSIYFNILIEFNNKKIAGHYIYLLVVVEFFLLTYFTVLKPNVAARIGVISLCGALAMFASMYILLVSKAYRPASHLLTASMFAICGIMFTIRAFHSFFIDTDPNRLPFGHYPVESMAYITFFITSVMLTFGFILMCNDEFAIAIKLATDEIIISEKQLNDAQRLAKIGSWKFNLLTYELVWSKEHYRIFELEETTPDKLYDAYRSKIHPDDIGELDRVVNLATEQGLGFKYEHRVLCKNGSIKTVLGIGETVIDTNGKTVLIYGSVQDFTEQKKEEQRLKLLESVITNTNDAILITEAEPFDEPGPRIIYVNEAFTKMTGYTAEEVIGKTPRILQGPNSDKEELARLSRAIRNWECCEISTIIYKKNGEEFWINFTLTPVADEKGWYTHWIAIERDVTAQKMKELANELLAKISLSFGTENHYVAAAKALCRSISTFGKFDWVEVWIPNLGKSEMQLLSHYVAAPDDEKFYDYSPDIKTFKMSEGLAGKVWAEGAQLLWDDIDNNNNFVRRDAAKKIGLKAVVGIPLIFHGEVVGVLKIGTKHKANYLKNHILLFKELEGYIGSELNRKKLENDLSHLFDAIPDIICIFDFKGRFLKINRAGCELLGYSEGEILYHSFEEFLYPADKDITYNEAQTFKQQETTFGFENRYLTKTGDIIWLSWNRNTSKEEGLIYATAKNITEEKKLRELNRQVGSLAKIGSWEMDLTNQKVFWSDEIHHTHETDPKSFVPTLENVINFYREDFRQMVRSNFEKCLITREPYDFEAVIVTAKMKERWVRGTGNPEFVDDVCKRVYGSFQDINDRKESENRLLALAENIPGVIYQYIIHPDGTDSMEDVSGDIEQLWGYTKDEVLKDITPLWDQIKMGGSLEEVKSSILKSIETKSKWTCRYKIVKPNGELKTHLGNGTLSFLADGTIIFNVMVVDITQEAKNEALLTQASEMARIGSWELDLINQDGDSMYWSPMVKEILEVDGSYNPTLTGGLEFYVGENKENVQQAVANLISEGLEFDEELLLLTAKGHERWIRIIGKSELANNKRTKIYGSFQDIDVRKKAEEELSTTSERLLLATTSAKMGIWDWDIVNDSLIWDNKMYELYGIEKTDFTGALSAWQKGVHPDDIEQAGKELTDAISGIRDFKTEFRVMWPDKSIHFIEGYGIVSRNGEEEAVRMIGVNIDITKRKKTEENLFQSNERFEKVTEATNDAIWDWDMVNKTFYRSKAFERFFGKDATGTFPDSDLWSRDRFHPEDFTKIQKSINEAITNPLTTRGELEYRLLNKKGKTVHVINRGVIIRNSKGKAIRMVGAMTDISEQKQMSIKLSELNNSLQQHTLELERSNEELEQFAFVASHDLQEPLRMISSFMELLKRKYGDNIDEKGHQYIHFATDGAKRMKQIILDLLDYSRAGKISEEKEVVSLDEVVSEFKQLRRKLISEKNATITASELPTLNIKRAVITQILHCLLDNALKYSLEDIAPIIEIDVAENESEWVFAVKDNGIGIDSQFHEKIFVIFQRLHNKEKYEGTGIGLSITKRHVEFLGGRIWLESKVEVGTKFYFTIPKN